MAVYKVGPCGGLGGSPFILVSKHGQSIKLLKIKINHGQVIDGIQVLYQDGEDHADWSPLWGGEHGKTDEIILRKDEYLKAINGHHEMFQGRYHVVTSLEFVSNRQKYGPYGDERGHTFSLPITNSKIVGFHGRSGLFLDSIGILVEPDGDGTDDAGHGRGMPTTKDSAHQSGQSNQISGGININITNTNNGNNNGADDSDKKGRCSWLENLIGFCAKIAVCALA